MSITYLYWWCGKPAYRCYRFRCYPNIHTNHPAAIETITYWQWPQCWTYIMCIERCSNIAPLPNEALHPPIGLNLIKTEKSHTPLVIHKYWSSVEIIKIILYKNMFSMNNSRSAIVIVQRGCCSSFIAEVDCTPTARIAWTLALASHRTHSQLAFPTRHRASTVVLRHITRAYARHLLHPTTFPQILMITA